MKKQLLLLLILLLSLAACGGAAGDTAEPAAQTAADAAATPDSASATQTAADAASNLAELQALVAAADPVDALSADYSGALSVRTQLALGTVQLDSTDRAVTAAQAETLLPLWQALQTLENSGTAADVEINAVVNQIQATMTREQLGGIAAMKLSEGSLDDLSFFNNNEEDGGFGGFMPGNFDGAPPNMAERPQGGGTGGPAGGGGAPPDGGGPGGGGGAIVGGGELGGEMDPSAMATSMAELADDPAALAEQMAIGLVIRSLQRATGDFQMGGPGGGSYPALLAVLADATGVDEAAVRVELSAGTTPADFLSAHDADAAAARAALVEALGRLELEDGTDVETLADELLAGTITMAPGGRGEE